MNACLTLKRYSLFVSLVRQYIKEIPKDVDDKNEEVKKSISNAIDKCIVDGILSEFLKQHRAKVQEASMWDYNEELHNKTLIKEGYPGKKLLELIYPLSGYVFKKRGKIYGYCRISRKEQSIDRQIRNIEKEYPGTHVIQEAFTGTRMDRPEWNKLQSKVKAGDTIIFDSVSRMSRSADEGIDTYFDLYERGVQLIFLKEHYIDTSVYAENI